MDHEIKIQTKQPILTYAMIGLFVFFFILELWLSNSFSAPNGTTLVSMGAVNHNLVFNFGEYYRLFTAAFLHGGYLHLILNSVAFFYIGPVLEMFVGRKWLFVLFGLSVLGGSLASVLLSSENIISVGASGGIMGLIAALFIVAFRLPSGAEKTGIQTNALYMLIPALLPVFTTIGGAKIDYGAHFGGAFVGALFGFFIYKSWLNKAEPGLKLLSTILTAIFAFVMGGAIIFSAINYSSILKELAVESKYLPPDLYAKYEKDPESYKDELLEWAKEWPQDPIIPYFQAMQAVRANDLVEGEKMLKHSLSLIDGEGYKYGRGEYVESVVRMTLAALYVDTGRMPEAKEMAKPLCDKKFEMPVPLQGLCL